MFGTIRKHQTWLWVVIISCTIVAFVIFFSPNSRFRGRGEVNYGSIAGRTVHEQDYQRALTEVSLRWLFMRGEWPKDSARQAGFDPMRETYQWLMLVQEQERLGIRVGSDAAAQFAKQAVRQFARDGSVNVPDFVKQVLQPRGVTMEDFERYIRHYLGIQELISAVAASGKLVTPQEIRQFYQRENQEVETEAVFLQFSNYLAKVTVTPEAISQFYSNRLGFYAIPERIKLHYVEFPLTNQLAKAEAALTNLAQRIDAAQAQMGTNLFQGAANLEESKKKIREALIREQAAIDLRRIANDFARPMLDVTNAVAEDLLKAAAKAGVTAKITEPFTRQDGPKEIAANQDFVRVAFALTTNDPIAGPLPGRDGFYVIAAAGTVPREIPTLESIRARVEQDYKEYMATTMAQEAGEKFQAQAATGLTQGKTFSALATEAGLKSVELPRFALSTREVSMAEAHLSLDQLKELAYGTEPGKVSQFRPTREGGVVLFVKGKLPINEAQAAKELPLFAERLRNARQNEAFQIWFAEAARRNLVNTPLGQVQPTPDLKKGPQQRAPAKS